MIMYPSTWGTEKIRLSCQGPYKFQILGNATLIVTDYKYGMITNKFALLDIKLWLKDDNILYQFWVFDWMNLNQYKYNQYKFLSCHFLLAIAFYPTQQIQSTFQKSMHKILKSLLLLDHVSDISNSNSISKLWKCGTWFLRLCNQNGFEFQIPSTEKSEFIWTNQTKSHSAIYIYIQCL